ncbi:MAG: hypothetical protein ABII18_03755 [bacterium]|nr:hypothetical protein [bacterium]MBU1918060.1 hypothetical protein [bacterium]
MNKKEMLIPIGEINREHGLKGYCKVYIYGGVLPTFHEEAHFILEKESERKQVIFIEEIKPIGRMFLVKFDCFKDSEEVVSWRKAILWCNKEYLVREDGALFDFEWEGFILHDPQGHIVGTIQNVIYNPLKQFVIIVNDEEKLVPVVDDWIVSCDTDKKEVVMDLPEGLL